MDEGWGSQGGRVGRQSFHKAAHGVFPKCDFTGLDGNVRRVKVCVPRVGIPFKVQGVFCSLEPEWAAAATEVKEQTKGKVKLAAVDATGNQVLASRYGVSVLGRLVSL